MLYATTRNNTDTFTAQRVLIQKRGPDGGFFVPFRLPRFSPEEIQNLGNRSFNQNLADTLNLFFNTRLTSYDLDLALGRSSVRLQQLGQKIVMGECWHNPCWRFTATVDEVTALLLTQKNSEAQTAGWAEMAIRIAVLFGIFGELIRHGIASDGKKVDVSLVSGNFDGPMAAWYARTMGLPIGNIVCCCNENGALWDFICHGVLRGDGIARETLVTDGDTVVPEGLERLIHAYGGPEEVTRYVETLRQGSTYYADDAFLRRLRQGIYVTVSSDQRIINTIPSALTTHGYLLGLSSALSYAGLLDYRARTGAMQTALILTEKSPRFDASRVSDVLGIDQQELEKYL